MKFYLITDDFDALTGMHLAGIEGELVSSAPEAQEAIEKACNQKDIAVLLVTDSIAALCRQTLNDIKLKRTIPLVTEIPNSSGSARNNDAIMKIVQEAIGM